MKKRRFNAIQYMYEAHTSDPSDDPTGAHLHTEFNERTTVSEALHILTRTGGAPMTTPPEHICTKSLTRKRPFQKLFQTLTRKGRVRLTTTGLATQRPRSAPNPRPVPEVRALREGHVPGVDPVDLLEHAELKQRCHAHARSGTFPLVNPHLRGGCPRSSMGSTLSRTRI
jgi:hypothetical protein